MATVVLKKKRKKEKVTCLLSRKTRDFGQENIRSEKFLLEAVVPFLIIIVVS